MRGALGGRLAPFVPVSVCRIPSPLYAVLQGYKAAPVAEARERFRRLLGEVLTDFLRRHAVCLAALAGGPLELTVGVPPSSRPGPPPLLRVPGVCLTPGLLVRGTGALGHLRASPAGFTVPASGRPAVADRRVLLLDDVYTTGARSQSAAAALRAAGATAVVVVAAGRVVRDGVLAPAAYRRALVSAGRHPRRCGVPGCASGVG